ncbi:MAG TPA: DUF481 domain-containing protein [Myxococcota bacterium]|nr:DUF481 domain-containing protein [Myxococcota bacterium]
MRAFLLFLCVLAVTGAWTARADQVEFTNGDKLTGKVVALKDGSLAFDSKLAGKIALNWKDVSTLSTDDPVTVQLVGGSVLVDKLVASDPGTVKTAGTDKVTGQTIELANADKLNPEPVQWKGTIVAGADIERGNTIKTGGAIDVNAERRSEQDRITFGAGYAAEEAAVAGNNNQEPTKSKAYGRLQYDYFFSKKLYGYGNAGGEKDRIADLDLRFTAGAGLGYQWFESEQLTWSTEAGASWVSENYTEPRPGECVVNTGTPSAPNIVVICTPTPNRNYAALRLASNLEYLLYPGLTFFQKTQLYPAFDLQSLLVDTATGLRYKLWGDLFGESKMLYVWNSDPANNKKRTDLAFILGIGYAF